MFGALPSRIARCRTGSASPSISRIDDPRRVGLDPLAGTLRDPLDHPEGVGVVVVRPEDDVEHDGDRGRDEGDTECRPERVDREIAVGDPVGCEEHQRIENEDEQEADDQHERQPKRRDHGRQERIEDGDHGRGYESAPEALHVAPGTIQAATSNANVASSHEVISRIGPMCGRLGPQTGFSP